LALVASVVYLIGTKQFVLHRQKNVYKTFVHLSVQWRF